jgi:adenine-specific DNA-methyltransferase
MADVYYAPDALNKENLELFVNNINPDRTPEDLLFQVMLDWGRSGFADRQENHSR